MSKKITNTISNTKGQTIVEAIVGLGLLTVVGFTFTGGMMSLRNSTKSAVLLSSTERQINDIAENIKAGVENYQVNFDYKTGTKESLNVETLPMAWDNGIITTRDKCPKCPGTYGFVIQPMEQYRGLYQVTMRLTHEAWKKNNEAFRDYTFVVSAK